VGWRRGRAGGADLATAEEEEKSDETDEEERKGLNKYQGH